MITDKFGLFTDNETVIANGESQAVGIMPFRGSGEPVHVTVLVTEPYNDGATMTVDVQESAQSEAQKGT